MRVNGVYSGFFGSGLFPVSETSLHSIMFKSARVVCCYRNLLLPQWLSGIARPW